MFEFGVNTGVRSYHEPLKLTITIANANFLRSGLSDHRGCCPDRRRPQHIVEVGRHLEAGQVRRRVQEERYRSADQRGDQRAKGHLAGALSWCWLHDKGAYSLGFQYVTMFFLNSFEKHPRWNVY